MVDKFAAEYGAVAYPTYVAEELAEIKAKHDALVADAQASVAESQERITVLSALVASMEANKVRARRHALSRHSRVEGLTLFGSLRLQVGPRTTLDQIYELYPDLQAEIEDEIDNHEWGKDIA